MLFSRQVLTPYLWPHGLQDARLPCPSPSPRVCSNSCSLNQWYHPTISSSVVPFSSCLQSFQASGSPNELASCIRWPKYWSSASVLPMNIMDWFPLGWTSLISLQSKGLSRVFSSTMIQNLSVLWCSAFFMVQFSHLFMTTGKTIALTLQTFVGKVMSLLFNTLHLS